MNNKKIDLLDKLTVDLGIIETIFNLVLHDNRLEIDSDNISIDYYLFSDIIEKLLECKNIVKKL